MMSLAPIMISLPIFLVFAPTLGEELAGCKCGGKYANGKAVTGCIEDRCSTGAAADNARCVTIYLNHNPIGYDCVPWLSHVADCATFDDGSRVCTDTVCATAMLGGNEEEYDTKDDHQVSINAQVNKNGLGFVMDSIKREVEAQVSVLQIADQRQMIPVTGLGEVNLTVVNITLDEFTAPSFSYAFLPPSSIRILTKGGSFNVSANWEVKKGILAPSGTVYVWCEGANGVELELAVRITVNEKGQLRLSTSDCKLNTELKVKFTGAVGSIANYVQGPINKMALSMANYYGCSMLDETMKTTVSSILDSLPTHIMLNDRYGFGYTFRDITFTSSAMEAQLASDLTFAEKAPESLLEDDQAQN